MRELLSRLLQPAFVASSRTLTDAHLCGSWNVKRTTITASSSANNGIKKDSGSSHRQQHHQYLLKHNYHSLRRHRSLATSASAQASTEQLPRRSLEAVRSRRSALFDAEAERQRDNASSRLKKIRIVVDSAAEGDHDDEIAQIEMWMNKDLSTPKDCAMHLKSLLVRRR